MEVVDALALVCLGATATRALLGAKVRVTRDRGTLIDSELAPLVAITVHPSSILRIREEEDRRLARHQLAADLAFVADRMQLI